MRIRHRIPTVFSLYMVDVLCCALGCVLLIWLDQSHTATQNLDAAAEKLAAADRREEETKQHLSEAKELLADLNTRLENAEADKKNLKALLATLEGDKKNLTTRLDTLEADKKDVEKRLSAALLQTRELDDKMKERNNRVVSLEKELQTLLSQLNDAKTTATDLGKDLKDAQATAALVPDLRKDLKMTKEKLAEEAALALALDNEVNQRLKELKELNKTLADLRDTKATLETKVDVRDKELAAAKVYRTKLEAAEQQLQLLEKQMTQRQKELALAEEKLATLTTEKNRSLDELARLKSAEDARFAGIQLTGKRVVFLIDMSGSMELVDEKTEAPEKWRGVRETAVKIMRSLPELEKFQVIVFSDKPSYLFGDNGGWIDYEPRTSSDRTFKALAAIKPKGGTNMYTAMETAFKLRTSGLDTIYFLSDGLPNLGEGLTREQAAKMTELEIGEVLGKVIRKKLKSDWNKPLPKQPAVRINTVGFFYESPDVGAFLWALAREHDGSFVGMSKP